MQLKIKFFFFFKELAPSGNMTMHFDKNISISELREALIEALSETSDREKIKMLIADCALGNAEQVLRDDYLISESENLVLLPPVCGG